MSTRAFYEFYGKKNQKLLGIHIHWNGYPQGAARYLKKAIDKIPGYLESPDFPYDAEQFLSNFVRFNKEAQISIEEGIHGDEEYIYKIDLVSKRITTVAIDRIKAEAAAKFEFEFKDPCEFFETIDECSIAEFLEKYKRIENSVEIE